MAEPVSNLSAHLKLIIEEMNKKNEMVTFEAETNSYFHRIQYFENKFNKYHEETTPKTVLSSLYNCMGRLKFFGDRKLYIYMELGERAAAARRATAVWPVRLTWKLEIFDEENDQAVSLGQASCVFNRPRQGFVAHPNDWISIDLDKIVKSKCIARDGSATLKWTVDTTPMLQVENIEGFKQTLEELQRFCDSYVGPEEQLNRLLEIFNENGNKLNSIDGKLSQLETMLDDFKKNFEKFKSDTEPVIELIKRKPRRDANMPPTKRIKSE